MLLGWVLPFFVVGQAIAGVTGFSRLRFLLRLSGLLIAGFWAASIGNVLVLAARRSTFLSLPTGIVSGLLVVGVFLLRIGFRLRFRLVAFVLVALFRRIGIWLLLRLAFLALLLPG